MTIEERSTQLLNDVLEKYYSREKWDNRPLMQMIDDEMLNYNDEISAGVNAIIGTTLAKSFTKSIPTVIPTPVQLSNMLYKNGNKVAAETYQVLKAAQKAKITAKELAMQLYDGYNFKDERVIDVIEKLPKYVQKYVSKPSTQKAFISQINKLKTKPYRTAMIELNKAVDAMDSKAVDKALQTVLEEKSRYYSETIAKTEIQRSKTLSNANDMLSDEDIELVRYEMSSLHKIMDECDYHANLDVGYGKGIVPKEQMVSLGLHPRCMCKYSPYYKKAKYNKVKNPTDKVMSRYTADEQRQIAGSWDKLKEYKEGKDIKTIWNSGRKKQYYIQPVVDVLENTRKFNNT